MKEHIYEFVYTDNKYESTPFTVSLHYTKKGAELAMEFHKQECRKEYNEMIKQYDGDWDIEFGEHEIWAVIERNIQP